MPPPHLCSQVLLDDTIDSLSTVTPEGVGELLVSWVRGWSVH
jgi:hypothetical protein